MEVEAETHSLELGVRGKQSRPLQKGVSRKEREYQRQMGEGLQGKEGKGKDGKGKMGRGGRGGRRGGGGRGRGGAGRGERRGGILID